MSLALAGCGGQGGFATTAELADAPRRPDGVAIDPASEPPLPRDSASAEDGFVTLRTPLGSGAAIDVVKELFERVAREDGPGLELLFTKSAVAINSRQSGSRNVPRATEWWGQRFNKLDYELLATEPVYRETDVELFRGRDVLDGAIRAPAYDEGLEAEDVVVRVPIHRPRIGAIRLLGDEIVLFLRRVGNRYKIYRMVEEFTIQ